MELTASKPITVAFYLFCLPLTISSGSGNPCNDIKPPSNGFILHNNANSDNRLLEVVCRPGFRLSGPRWRICTSAGKWTGVSAKCEDIDECSAQGKGYPCHSNANCINTLGSFRCVCLPGYFGNGFVCKRSEQNLLRKSNDKCGIVELTNSTMDSRKRFRRVVAGKDTYPGEWPWQARIEIKRKARLPFLAGALIKPGWVLTVANQLFIGTRPVKAGDLKVILGDYDREKHESHEQRYEVESVFIHPKYDRENVAFDIALLKLKGVEKRTAYVNSICLVSGRKARIFEEREYLATVTGWGTSTVIDIGENPGVFARKLKQATIPLRHARTCKKATAYDFHSRSMLCAGYIDGVGSPCFGDHGAPLVIQEANSDRWILLGLYSWSEGCGRKEKFSYYTRVSKFRKWIASLIRKVS